MAQQKRKSSGKKRSTAKKPTQKRRTKAEIEKSESLRTEIILLVSLAVSILLLISNLGIGGMIGGKVSGILFGIFGITANAFPFILFLGTAFYLSNKGNRLAKRKMTGAVLCFLFLCAFLQLITSGTGESSEIVGFYRYSQRSQLGGGVVGGSITKLLSICFGTAGTYVIVVAVLIIGVIIMTQRPIIAPLTEKSSKLVNSAKEEVQKHRQERVTRRSHTVSKENQPVTVELEQKEKRRHKTTDEVNTEQDSSEPVFPTDPQFARMPEFTELHIERSEPVVPAEEPAESPVPEMTEKPVIHKEKSERKKNPHSSKEEIESGIQNIQTEIEQKEVIQKPEYHFPPLELLKKGSSQAQGDSDEHLRETARKLQSTLHSFGVNVTVTNVSCGPTVTRYELQPEQGVKVSRIVSLSDDIKLNLAAADIRIEAPIPGKAAVGIEVPNATNSPVMLRDLLDTGAFKKHPSKLAFATGKDIAGQPVVSDIAKMPHLLIAGATGSGKSVCINTLIMSILYKADPNDVKLIMIDPKVVELSVYNGIPHLFIPVVTDPKKAAGALNWAVAEMTDRYNKFAEYNVRDLKGYNAKVEAISDIEDEQKPQKLPQIVIIVDELADLMMVAPGEVEDAICRLAQLARAAGIHLIIATQRPSVNVITGLIKANMPSRIAFAVSSGVDSRTILDMNGAEKLLGKGDMLFYPQGYQKPARLQGAFVSDKEVAAVVSYLTEQMGEQSYDPEIEQKINSVSSAGTTASGNSADERDVYFVEAGKFIIEKDKASIGMLQRMFKIGFNRAARIMDQLCEAGVVGEEEGTKPRKVLMTLEQFENYIEESL